MLSFTVLTAAAVPLEIAKIDTGMILPGRFMRRHRRPGHDYSDAFLHDLRFDGQGRPRPDFVLNVPAYRNAKILVTDADFGCGSSREGAAFAVMDFGLRALVGPSFGEIFQVNCIQNGIPAIVLAEAIIRDIQRQLRERPGSEVTIDLPESDADRAGSSRPPFRHQSPAEGPTAARYRRYRRDAAIARSDRKLRSQAAGRVFMAADGTS